MPGTPGLEHRIGGIEKADVTGEISYDPDNHDRMVRLRQAKIDGIAADIAPLEVDDPDGTARVLVLGWGSTFGSIGAAVRRASNAGHSVAQAHLRTSTRSRPTWARCSATTTRCWCRKSTSASWPCCCAAGSWST